MAEFKYTGKDADGGTIRGVYEAGSEVEVARMLKQRGFYPTGITTIKGSKDITDFGIFNKIKVKDIYIFCRQFSTLIGAGLTVVSSLDILKDQTQNKILKKDLEEVVESVREGVSLSSALRVKKRFPEILINMLEVGESGGTLETILHSMAENFEKEAKLKQKLKSASTYPIIVLVITFAVVFFLLTNVVPAFVRMFVESGLTLPLPTRMLLGLSGFFVSYGIWLGIGIVVCIILFKYLVSAGKGKELWHKAILKLPVAGKIVMLVNATSFTRTMSMMLSAGVPLLEALELAKKVMTNAEAEKALTMISEEIKVGNTLWQGLDKSKFFPKMISHMVRVGEESGSLDSVLKKTASFFEEESETYMLKATTMIEPALILGLGGVVIFVVMSIALPMFEMMGAIQ